MQGGGFEAAPAVSRLTVGFILANDFTLSAFSLFVDTLRLAADDGDRSRPIRCRWAVMSRKETIRASCGVTVQRTSPLVEPTSFDYIVVVGGLLQARTQIDEETTAYLQAAAAKGVTIVGVCTGSFILARAGLMRGRRVCVSWYHHQDFINEFPDVCPVSDRLFIVDGNRITCSGGSSVAHLASYLVERRLGRAVAQKSLHVLQFDHARSGSEAQPHPPLASAVGDERVRRALLLMEQNIAEPLPIGQIAARLGLSVRQLERLFRTVVGSGPGAVYRTLRLRYARWLIETTDRSVTDVAFEAGFADCAHFSRQFRSIFGLTPTSSRSIRLQDPLPSQTLPQVEDEGVTADRRVFG